MKHVQKHCRQSPRNICSQTIFVDYPLQYSTVIAVHESVYIHINGVRINPVTRSLVCDTLWTVVILFSFLTRPASFD